MQVTFKGQPIEVQGTTLNVGDTIPNVQLKNLDNETVHLYNLLDSKQTILSVMPNVLTRTCELQTKRFNEESLDNGFKFLAISRNTPQEFREWNEENELSTPGFSDFNQEFGNEVGLNIHLGDNDLLARAVFIVNQEGEILYREVVEEVSQEPNYQAAIDALDANF